MAPDPITRFSNRAADYARARPSYPDAAIEAILEGAPGDRSITVADVGAGTGIATLLLARHVAVGRVLAVEPNAAMRDAATAHERVSWIDGTGERTTLGDASVDVVVCAQAFHWLDADAALQEFARIIDPASALRRVVLMWNQHDTEQPAMRDYCALMQRHAVDPPSSPWDLGACDALERAPGFRDARRLTFPNAQTLTRDGLMARAFSASYLPSEGAPADAASRDLRAFFDTHALDNRVTLAYDTVLHLGERHA